MSWDERLFGRAYRGVARLFGRTPPARLDDAALEAARARLGIVAAAIAGRRVEVAFVADAGGVARAALYLPAPAPDASLGPLLLRVAHDATALRLGLGHDGDLLDRQLATVLAVAAIRRAIATTLPAAADDIARARAGWLALRTAPLPRGPGGAIEALIRCSLGADLDALRAPAATLRWASWAATCAPASAAALNDAVRAARGRLAALGDAGAAAIAPPGAWGWFVGGAAEVGAPVGPAAAPHRPTGTSRELTPRPITRQVALGEGTLDQNPLVHSFEKLHTAEDYTGGNKQRDGQDELAEQAEAISELELGQLVRTSEPADALLRADIALTSSAGDLASTPPLVGAISYDEWDERHRRYRRAWCSVFEDTPQVATAAARALVTQIARHQRGTIDALHGDLRRIALARRWRGRQPDGADLDVDALVDRHGALASGHTPPDRLYVDRRRQPGRLAVLVLIDASLSTDGWVDDRRVLDVEREAAIVLAEALDGLPDPLAIAAFSSNTRRDCRFTRLKDFAEPWAATRARIGALEPAGYTRIGPAIRHATARLATVDARRRLLIVISDGKPTDYDRYEGRYGIADVRQAVREADRAGVHSFALAVDPRARLFLPALFGFGHYQILRRAAELPRALGRLYTQLAA